MDKKLGQIPYTFNTLHKQKNKKINNSNNNRFILTTTKCAGHYHFHVTRIIITKLGFPLGCLGNDNT